MKRRLAFILALVLLVTVAFGCAASYPATPEPAEADDPLYPPSEDVQEYITPDEYIDSFEADDYPDPTVENPQDYIDPNEYGDTSGVLPEPEEEAPQPLAASDLVDVAAAALASPGLPPTGSGTSDDPLSYWQGLFLYVPPGSVTPTGLRLSTVNNSQDISFGYGVPFTIEQYLDGAWREPPFLDGNWAWIMPLHTVFTNSINDYNIVWDMHGQLPPGQYRIVRNFMELDPYCLDTLMREQSAYLFAHFTIEEDWQTAHDIWLAEQEAVAAVAFARFEGLDLEILSHSPRGLSFTLTNNNPTYSYIINSAFMGWENRYPGGGGSGAVEYTILTHPQAVRLQPGESLSRDVDWYYAIGNLTPREAMDPDWPPPHPRVFDLVVDVELDVDEQYRREHFRHRIPGLPDAWHRISASFEIFG